LFVVDGPLKDFEFSMISHLYEMGKRLVVCVNKQDWYGQDDMELLLRKIRTQLASVLDSEDVVPVQAKPLQRVRIRILAGGSEVAETVSEPADVSAPGIRMTQVVRKEGKELLLSDLLLQSRSLREEAIKTVKSIIDQRARSVVDNYTWRAAAASPVSVLDVAAGLGFSLKMILDLAEIYRKRIDFEAAKKLLNQLMKNLFSSLGASALAPAVTHMW